MFFSKETVCIFLWGSKSSLSSVSSLFGGAILHLETLIFWPALGRTSGHIFGLWGGGQFPEEGSSFIHYQCAPSASISLNFFLLILSFTFVSCRSQRTKVNPNYVRVYCHTRYLSNNLHDQFSGQTFYALKERILIWFHSR